MTDARPTVTTCEHCGESFPVPNPKGPIPKYCSNAHRQRAKRIRHKLSVVQ